MIFHRACSIPWRAQAGRACMPCRAQTSNLQHSLRSDVVLYIPPPRNDAASTCHVLLNIALMSRDASSSDIPSGSLTELIRIFEGMSSKSWSTVFRPISLSICSFRWRLGCSHVIAYPVESLPVRRSFHRPSRRAGPNQALGLLSLCLTFVNNCFPSRTKDRR